MTLTTTGAEIRGSDVWTSWNDNVSTLALPLFWPYGVCLASSDKRCALPEQVFIDGVPQYQLAVGAAPGPGQFVLDSGRHVVLGSSPESHVVEVTTRTHWIHVVASDVTVSGFRMKHSSIKAQHGALEVGADDSSPDGVIVVDRATIKNNVLSDAAGAVVALHGGGGHQILGNDVSRGGQLGISISGAPITDVVVRGNRLHENNTEDFDWGWEAGAFKGGYHVYRLTFDANTIDHNFGQSIWCDGNGDGWTISGNVVHHNYVGIAYETCSDGLITDNRVWENGWRTTAWGWGAGILVFSSTTVEVRNNIVAWNADGIALIAHVRPDQPGPYANHYAHDNTIIVSRQPSDTSDIVSLGFLSDNDTGATDPSRNNRGDHNSYWLNDSEPSYCRFQWGWGTCLETLAAFNATPGEEGGRYLTTSERDTALRAAGIPLLPQPH